MEKELEYLITIKSRCTQYLRKTSYYENETLSVDRRGKTPKYTIKMNKDGLRKEVYIGDADKRVDIVCARQVIKTVLTRIECRIRHLNKTLSVYQTINPNSFRDHLPYAYRDIPRVVFDILEIADMSAVDNYAFSDNSMNFYPEHLIHSTSTGELLRSKGELVITYILDKLGIKYEYEKVMEVNGKLVAPDFLLTSPDGTKQVILEYFGMMGNEEYRKKAAEKIAMYIEAGFIPGKDILFIFDDMDGAFDGQKVEQMLREWAGIR
ncbi:MAG: hypothetical protein IJH91_08615 [Mogibacterium sp.]|nr:hypothetical protein [Mogibacterium sp.]